MFYSCGFINLIRFSLSGYNWLFYVLTPVEDIYCIKKHVRGVQPGRTHFGDSILFFQPGALPEIIKAEVDKPLLQINGSLFKEMVRAYNRITGLIVSLHLNKD
jgi:hypothetical protein